MTKIARRLLGIMILRQAVEKASEQESRSYPAPHCGRPGEKGGSLPRDECAALKKEKEKKDAPMPSSADEAAAQKHRNAVEAEPALTKLVRRLTREAGGEVHDLRSD